MFEQVFKNIDDILHKDAGCGSELDRHTSTNKVAVQDFAKTANPDNYIYQ